MTVSEAKNKLEELEKSGMGNLPFVIELARGESDISDIKHKNLGFVINLLEPDSGHFIEKVCIIPNDDIDFY